MKVAGRTLVQSLAVAVVAIGAVSLSVALGAPSGKCPAIYAPVTCDNGKTYPNQCVADQHHAKNCVPAGGL